MKKLLMLVLFIFAVSCKEVTADCLEDHFRSFGAEQADGNLVAVFNLHQDLIFAECNQGKTESELYLIIDNATDYTVSFDYEVTFKEGSTTTAYFKGSVHKLKPGESTEEKLVSTDLVDLNLSTIIMSGTNLEFEP